MVNRINIKKLNLEELAGVVSLYPWFGGARRELCERLKNMDSCTVERIAETALYLGSRKTAYDILYGNVPTDCTDSTAPKPQEEEADTGEVPVQNPIFVVGGDYFSRSDYDRARREEDNIFADFAKKALAQPVSEVVEEAQEEDGFCTETLAKIYLEQDYPEEARKIYSKLSLRYPEKSVYFAALIDEIDKNN